MKWYVKEGDHVNAGDTILQIGEIKEDYFDPNLLSRTEEQLVAKEQSLGFYQNKINATESQKNALNNNRQLKQEQLGNKIRQLQLKLQADSAESVAADNDYRIAQLQFGRQQQLYDSGLVSLTQLEQRNQSLQNALAKKIGAGNKLVSARQELINAGIEINALNQDYSEKVAKAESEQYQSLSQIAGGRGEIAKLQNQFSNYRIRNGMYFVTAPQSGQVIKAKKAGIGEIIKDGEMLVEIVPDNLEYAAELFISPMDLPLISHNQKVQFQFDGFPAIVFSGWPGSSYGTFTGVVVAIENAVGANGKFRVLVKEDPVAKKAWPRELKMGTGVQGIALLKNVPVWYELWRNINGFPPDFYVEDKTEKSK
jgi:multidrug resistance efflux pump